MQFSMLRPYQNLEVLGGSDPFLVGTDHQAESNLHCTGLSTRLLVSGLKVSAWYALAQGACPRTVLRFSVPTAWLWGTEMPAAGEIGLLKKVWGCSLSLPADLDESTPRGVDQCVCMYYRNLSVLQQ